MVVFVCVGGKGGGGGGGGWEFHSKGQLLTQGNEQLLVSKGEQALWSVGKEREMGWVR